MDPVRLKVFREVAERGTFAAAAYALSFTPSAVSQQMTKLERELGIALFERTTRGVVLTDAGRALAARAETILNELDEARRELTDIARGRAGRVRVGSFPSAASTLVAQAVCHFRFAHPEVTVRLFTGEPPDILLGLRRRDLDVGLIVQTGLQDPGVDLNGERVVAPEVAEIEHLLDDPFVVALSADDPLAEHERIDPAHLQGRRLIGTPRWPGVDALAAACAAEGIQLRFDAYLGNDYHAVQALVAGGQGAALVPAIATMSEHGSVVHRRLARFEPRRRISIATAAGAPRPPAAAAVIATLRELTAGLDDGWMSAQRPVRPPVRAHLRVS